MSAPSSNEDPNKSEAPIINQPVKLEDQDATPFEETPLKTEENNHPQINEAPDIQLNSMQSNSHISTLYVANIDWTLTKAQIRRSLFHLFSRHGKVLKVIYLRHTGLAGRAFVIFESSDVAAAAMNAEQGFLFFERPLQISLAKEPSDVTRKRAKDFSKVDRTGKRQLRQQEFASRQAVKIEDVHVAVPQPNLSLSPTHILFANNLPPLGNPEFMLSMLARQYPGFQEVRLPRANMAFLQFETPAHAAVAMGALNGYKLTETDVLTLTYSGGMTQ